MISVLPPAPIGFLRAPRPVLMLLLAAFFWGSGNVANKTVLQEIDPWAAVALRCLVAALFLLPFALREARRPKAAYWLPSSLIPSGFFALGLALQQFGYQTATVTNASFLVNAACVLTPVLAFVLFREPPGRAIALAAGLMFAGALVMSGATSSLARVNPGDLLCLLSALAYACWAVTLERHAKRHGRPVATTLVHCMLTMALALPLAVSAWPEGTPLPYGALPEVLYLGVFSTALAFLLTVAAQARVSASVASVLVAAESLFGAAGGILFLGERPGQAVLLGAALMLLAILTVAAATTGPPAPKVIMEKAKRKV
ncbi:DMT family transporter [Tabrizicola sp.]|uniref:DMT family transporter n=1 Tax=Tabrizicola sp. TaxID=2005166 RepID=UPI003F2F81B0